jgi:hypothetical protein
MRAWDGISAAPAASAQADGWPGDDVGGVVAVLASMALACSAG